MDRAAAGPATPAGKPASCSGARGHEAPIHQIVDEALLDALGQALLTNSLFIGYALDGLDAGALLFPYRQLALVGLLCQRNALRLLIDGQLQPIGKVRIVAHV